MSIYWLVLRKIVNFDFLRFDVVFKGEGEGLDEILLFVSWNCMMLFINVSMYE